MRFIALCSKALVTIRHLLDLFLLRIIGLYTTFVFLASRVLRGFFSGIYTKIMFDDLPNVDRVLQLCLDIYLVGFLAGVRCSAPVNGDSFIHVDRIKLGHI